MAFQKQINMELAKGIAGKLASLNPAVYDLRNMPAGTDGIEAGLAVWEDNGTVVNEGTGAPLGIALAWLVYPNWDLRSAGSMSIAEGETVTVLKKGDVFVNSTTAATVGQKVFANLTGGTFSTNTAGATVAGSVETDWVVVEGGDANDLITISNWS